MYENQNYEEILERQLERISDGIDKREGSIIWDSLSPASLEIAQLYWELDNLLNESYADTASREYLIRRVADRNVQPKAATNAIVQGTFLPAELELPAGSRFNLDEFNYAITAKTAPGVYHLRCETAGTAPNSNLGEVTPIDYIEGLLSGQITEVLIQGEDEESDDALLTRYLQTFGDQASAGNIAWYKTTIGDLQGVGGVKVLRAWNGPGTVKCFIQAADYSVPSDQLVNSVQTKIDPTQNHGDGLGLAPIGHVVTIEPVEGKTIDIVSSITLQSGVLWEDIKSIAEAEIDGYLKSLNSSWQDSENLIVRISQIETRLLNVIGIVDVADTSINGAAANCVLQSNEVAVRGSVSNG